MLSFNGVGPQRWRPGFGSPLFPFLAPSRLRRLHLYCAGAAPSSIATRLITLCTSRTLTLIRRATSGREFGDGIADRVCRQSDRHPVRAGPPTGLAAFGDVDVSQCAGADGPKDGGIVEHLLSLVALGDQDRVEYVEDAPVEQQVRHPVITRYWWANAGIRNVPKKVPTISWVKRRRHSWRTPESPGHRRYANVIDPDRRFASDGQQD